jgi:hypothetical protein
MGIWFSLQKFLSYEQFLREEFYTTRQNYFVRLKFRKFVGMVSHSGVIAPVVTDVLFSLHQSDVSFQMNGRTPL